MSTFLQDQTDYTLKSDRIYIWLIDATKYISVLSQSFHILNNDEKKRHQLFFFQKEKDVFLCAHVGLRIILSRFLKCDPDEIIYEYNEYKKPSINNNHLHFNISHSKNMIAIAITNDVPVGIDIECKSLKVATDDISHRFFSALEYRSYKKVPKSQKINSFYKIWTQKEAYIKAVGKGLYLDLQNFDVEANPKKESKILSINKDSDQAKSWNLYSFVHEESFYSCVAWKGNKKEIVISIG
jgi:4'-phosphopantetheinyl transferase